MKMVNLRQNTGLDLPQVIVPFTELDLPMFEGLPDKGWLLTLLEQPHDIFFQLHSARTHVQLLHT